MVPYALPNAPKTGSGRLWPYPDNQAVYDPKANITWIVDANLAAKPGYQFNQPVNVDGAMTYGVASSWLSGLNTSASAPERFTHWQLPSNTSQLKSIYEALGFTTGQSVLTTDAGVGPFANLQPYLYWSCQRNGTYGTTEPCSATAQPNPGQEWSFDFGNGLQGTDDSDPSSTHEKMLYVMVYAPEPPGMP
jgi:hypothetical protein